MLVKFKIRSNLRFLSHAETVRVLQRSCARTGVRVKYSQGFNPHPRLSLPLPRSVGIESDEELLCLRVDATVESFDASRFKTELCNQLPEGCELLSVEVSKEKVSYQPTTATYVFAVRQECLDEKLKDKIEYLLASKSLNLQRRIDEKGNVRNVEVRGFLQSVELADGNITVKCKINAAGSIRVDEILELLKLDAEKLAAPVRRTNVEWQET